MAPFHRRAPPTNTHGHILPRRPALRNLRPWAALAASVSASTSAHALKSTSFVPLTRGDMQKAQQTRSMVHLRGKISVEDGRTMLTRTSAVLSTTGVGERPPDPSSLLQSSPPDRLRRNVDRLASWFEGKRNVLCLTGAGLSTESGIPDYRGNKGAYRSGHKPMVHDQFCSSETDAHRKRYWGRSMAGWRAFASTQPNEGHRALTALERMGGIGVDFYHPGGTGGEHQRQKVSIITQNVDALHHRAESRNVVELHGRNDRLVCMRCGSYQCRHSFHDTLEELNGDWLSNALSGNDDNDNSLRPDGDAEVTKEQSYDSIVIPPCQNCRTGYLKPDVVFFGDSVPRDRVDRCFAAVRASDGLLCVGSSLAVHSAFRFVKAAADTGIPIAILNVGETRAETSGMEVTKVESPAGATLSALADLFLQEVGQDAVEEGEEEWGGQISTAASL